jgi:hypothetical protein
MRLHAVLMLPLAVMLLLPGARARADVAATGTFDIAVSLTPPNVPFDGEISFDTGSRTALGATVDMAGDVGDMTFEGDAVVDVNAESATFSLVAESTGDFEFGAMGAGSCESSGCVGGSATFAGRFTSITDPDDVLPDGVYTFDGTAEISFLGQGPGGTFAINAFPVTATPTGAAVEVSAGSEFYNTVADEVRTFLASARFDSVSAAGGTQFVAFSALPGAFPAGVNFNGMISVFVDVSTTATVAGNVRLCLGYPDADHNGIVDGTVNNISETRLRLLHATAIGAAFTDVTATVGNERVCGNVGAVGPITLGVLPAGATTTTVVSTTTSSSLAVTSTTALGESSTTTSTAAPGESTTTTTTLEGGTSTSTTVPPGGATTTSTTFPSAPLTTTTVTVSPGGSTTTTLPVCTTALECLDVAIAGPLCPGETVNAKLSTFILNKLAKAQTALLGTRSTSSAKKIAKLVAKAGKQLDKVGTKADAFVSRPKGPISADCRDRIRTAAGRVTQQIQANRI